MLALVLVGGCVDKAPPPLWPAPPPPSVATPITSTTPAVPTPASTGVAAAAPGVEGDPPVPPVPPVDADAPNSSILDPTSPAATGAPKGSPPAPRPVPSHK